MLLVTHGHATFERHRYPNLGRLIQPREWASISKTAALGIPWAADNDCFQGLHRDRFERMLKAIHGLSGCLFVVVPDVLCDHTATLASFREWAPQMRRREIPLAFVLQNGCTSEEVPWDEIAAVFVGGDDAFKLGPEAAALVREAKRRGLWAHMGRVNSAKRTKYAQSIGCDSIDGTRNSKFIDTYLATSLAQCAAPAQAGLPC